MSHKLSISLFVLLIGGILVSCQQNQEQSDSKESTGKSASSDSIVIEQQWELSDQIDRPESAVYNPQQNVVYISNMVGGASDKDGKGYISKITPAGKMMEARWADGMNAPKGLAISGNFLYAADIDELVMINLNTGQITDRYPAVNAVFLNDVTADSAGHVYVSDSRTSSVYRMEGDTLKPWLQGDSIRSPNGLYAETDRLIIAAGSKGAGEGRFLQAIDYETREVTALGNGEPIGELDAVQPNGRGGYFLTDWGAGTVMSYHSDSGVTVLKTISQGTADLDYIEDQQMIILPVMMSDRILGFQVR